MVARRLERVSDQARNISMETLYMCTGEIAKHPGSEVFQVLFVDEHNACRSVIAEMIGTALKEPDFRFSSAGLVPSPVTDDQFAASRGRREPGVPGMTSVANLIRGRHHLLAPKAGRPFRRPRHSVLSTVGQDPAPWMRRQLPPHQRLSFIEIRSDWSAIRDTRG
jgi:hypothetical protein